MSTKGLFLNGHFSNVGGLFFVYFKCHQHGCLKNPICSNLGYVLYVEHILCVVKNFSQHLCHPLSFPSSSLSLVGEKNIPGNTVDVIFSLKVNCDLQIVLFMWRNIMIPVYRLCYHGLHGSWWPGKGVKTWSLTLTLSIQKILPTSWYSFIFYAHRLLVLLHLPFLRQMLVSSTTDWDHPH